MISDHLKSRLRAYGREVDYIRATAPQSGHPAPSARPPRLKASVAAALTLAVLVVALAVLRNVRHPEARQAILDPAEMTIPGPAETAIPDRTVATSVNSVPASDVTSPPSEIEPDLRLFVHAMSVPTSGADLALAVVNGSPHSFIYGRRGLVEEWNGSSWVHQADFLATMKSAMRQFGEILALDDFRPTFSISAEAAAGSVGALAYLRMPALSAGRYRLCYHEVTGGRQACGQVDVSERHPPVPPIDPRPRRSSVALLVSPAIVSPDGCSLRVSLLEFGESSAERIAELIGGLAAEADVRRWTGTSWEALLELPVTLSDDGQSATIALPPLSSDYLTLAVEHRDLGELRAELWVHPGAPACPTPGP